jgi:hypothetical protein
MRALLLFTMAAAALAQQPKAPEQPIPYSHKLHVGMGLKCKECHTMPEPGELMTIPATAKCMTCHATVKKDSPAIQKLAGFAAQNKPVPWVRVYQIPSYVLFAHKSHLEGGATCETCHGKVAERDQLWREGDVGMTACMTCHREHKASNDCGLCHEPRN